MSTASPWPSRAPWSVGLANHLNLTTLPIHANQILVTALVYQGLFGVVSPLLSKALVPKTYENLSPKSRVNWDSRVVGFVQAAYITTKAVHVIFTDPSRPNANAQQRLWGYSTQAGELQAYAAGYFLWDIYISSTNIAQFGPSALVHAVTAFTISLLGFVSYTQLIWNTPFGALSLTRPQKPFANYYGVNFVLYELSTPFLNVHWMLDKLGKTGSNLQLYNGIALTTTFFGCRLVWGSYQTWLLSADMLSAWQSGPVPRLLFGTYLIGNATLTGLNFYWFSKMVQALRKRFTVKSDTE